MVEMGVGQKHEIDFFGVEAEVGGVLLVDPPAALEQAAIDQNFLPAASSRWHEPVTPRSAPWKDSFIRRVPGPISCAPRAPIFCTLSKISCAVSANQKSSRSSRSITPSSARKSKSTAPRQNSSPTSTMGIGRFLRVCTRVSTSNNSSQRAVAAGKGDQRPRPLQEMQLAQGEIVELEAQFRRDIGIGILLVRQADVEADALRADVEGAAIGRLHDARSAAGDDQRGLVVGWRDWRRRPACRIRAPRRNSGSWPESFRATASLRASTKESGEPLLAFSLVPRGLDPAPRLGGSQMRVEPNTTMVCPTSCRRSDSSGFR